MDFYQRLRLLGAALAFGALTMGCGGGASPASPTAGGGSSADFARCREQEKFGDASSCWKTFLEQHRSDGAPAEIAYAEKGATASSASPSSDLAALGLTPVSAATPATTGTPTPVTPPPPPPPSTSASGTEQYGTWKLQKVDGDLVIRNDQRPEGVVIRLYGKSNGWLWMKTESGSWVYFSNQTTQKQSFSVPSFPSGSLPDFPGRLELGDWTLETSGDDLFIKHPRNTFKVRLWKKSNGWVEVVGGSKGNHTVFSSGDPTPGGGAETPAVASGAKVEQYGKWKLYDVDGDVVIVNDDRPSGVIMRLYGKSNGWAWIKTESGSWVYFSNQSTQAQAFDVPPSVKGTSYPTFGGRRQVGDWTLETSGDDLFVKHPRNSFKFRFWKTSNGWIEVVGGSKGNQTIFSAGKL